MTQDSQRSRPRRVIPDPEGFVIVLSETRRCTLRAGNPEHRLYFAATAEDGVITLTPAVPIEPQSGSR